MKNDLNQATFIPPTVRNDATGNGTHHQLDSQTDGNSLAVPAKSKGMLCVGVTYETTDKTFAVFL